MVVAMLSHRPTKRTPMWRTQMWRTQMLRTQACSLLHRIRVTRGAGRSRLSRGKSWWKHPKRSRPISICSHSRFHSCLTTRGTCSRSTPLSTQRRLYKSIRASQCSTSQYRHHCPTQSQSIRTPPRPQWGKAVKPTTPIWGTL